MVTLFSPSYFSNYRERDSVCDTDIDTFVITFALNKVWCAMPGNYTANNYGVQVFCWNGETGKEKKSSITIALFWKGCASPQIWWLAISQRLLVVLLYALKVSWYHVVKHFWVAHHHACGEAHQGFPYYFISSSLYSQCFYCSSYDLFLFICSTILMTI